MIRITDFGKAITQATNEAINETPKVQAQEPASKTEEVGFPNLADVAHRIMENAYSSVARQSQLGEAKILPAITKKTATQEEVLQGAHNAGLSDDEVSTLKTQLEQFKELDPAMYQRELQFLNNQV